MTTLTVPLHANGHWITRDRVDQVDVTVFELGNEKLVLLDRSRVSYSCALCGEFIETRDTKEGVYIDAPCSAAEGITTTIRLEVPSGKIVVDDDMRPLFNGFDHDGFTSYNSVLGQAQVIEAFAKDKCAFGPVGNSCPSLWKTGEDTYIIARTQWSTDEDEILYEDMEPAPEGARKLASICTDLWAYSIVDYDEWVKRGGDPEKAGWTLTIVEVPAGTYEFTHHSGELGFNDDEDHVVWADIKKVA